ARAGLEFVVLESAPLSGGQMMNTETIDNYPGLPGITGFEISQKMRSHADGLGAKFLNQQVEEIVPLGGDGACGCGDAGANADGACGCGDGGANADSACGCGDAGANVDGACGCGDGGANADGACGCEGARVKVVTSSDEYFAKNVLLATGATPAKLGVPGEEEFRGRGVSYCATCDGGFFRGRDVAVVGGGDTALSDAIYLSRICRKVYVIHRRDAFRGTKSLSDKLIAAENVEILWDTVVEEVGGTDLVDHLVTKNTKLGLTGELAVEGVFVAVGTVPQTDLVRKLVDCDPRGFVLAGEECKTSVEGIYAAGDIRKKPLRQIVTATADGANAIEAMQ
nr:FAD-dependent oxidoreductase [Lachnospiraceae bacterium]